MKGTQIMNTNNRILEEYYFDKKSREKILLQLSKDIKQINNKKDYKILMREVRNRYNDLEIQHLKQNYEINNSFYSNDTIISFSSMFIALSAFLISTLSSLQNTKTTRLITLLGTLEVSSKSNETLVYFFIFIMIIFMVYIFRRAIFPKKPQKLSDVIFLLEEVLKIPEPLL